MKWLANTYTICCVPKVKLAITDEQTLGLMQHKSKRETGMDEGTIHKSTVSEEGVLDFDTCIVSK